MFNLLNCRSKWLLFVLQLLIFQRAYGQREFNFTNLTTKSGLSSNTINVVLQDHNGLIWFGTNDGLNKFDGTNVTVYNHVEKDSASIPSNEIVALFEDKSGKLWVGTNSGLVSYDPSRNSFIGVYETDANKKKQFITARALVQDHAGNIWLGGYNIIRIIDPKTSKITPVTIKGLSPSAISALVVLSLFEDNLQRIWIGTNMGLFVTDISGSKFTRFVNRPLEPDSISGDEVRAIVQDARGNLFFGTNNGLNMLEPGGQEFRVFRHNDNQASISNNLIYSLAMAPDGKLWIGTEDGLNIFDLGNYTSLNIKPDRRKSFSLSNKCIRSICIAQKNIIWLGTYQGGVNKYDPNLALFNLEHSSPFDPHGLSSSIVTSFADYGNGGMFIGTDGGGLHFFDRNTGLFNYCDIKSKVDKSGNALSIMTLDIDSKKNIWIGTFQNGLFKYNPATRQYQQYLQGNREQDINQNDIFFIKEDSKGLVWIGTNGLGVNVLDPKTGLIAKYTPQPKGKNDFLLPLNGFMRAIFEEKNGDMWLGSVGTGIAVFHHDSHTFTVYNKQNSQLSHDAVLSMLHDRAGNIWVGTNGGGLNLFNKTTQKFTHLTEADGLANNIIYKVLEDGEGLIWVSTDKGISCIDPKTRKIKNFNRSNGVQDSPFIVGSGIIGSNGELFFGGQDGFNYFNPATLPTNNVMPRVLLTDLKVANNTVNPGEKSPIKEQINTAKDIYLSYGQNFSISYVALNYTAPMQNRYSYKLSGFDPNWNYVGKEKTAYYTNIDPGDYIFQVRASNNEGVWNSDITTIAVHFSPPIWRTVYAYFLYFVIVAGLLYYIRRRGIQKLKNKIAIEQEKINARQLIEEQRREAERVHELDMQKIKFLTNLSHEFRTPISLILAPADKLLSLPTESTISNHAKMIRRNARRLLNLVNQLLDFRKMEEQELNLNLVPGDLIAFIKEAAEAFQDLSDRKKILLTTESDRETLPATFDHDKIERIIFNLLSNAFKFTNEGGEICLKMSVKVEDDRNTEMLCLAISDTGIGIAAKYKDRVFERFFMDHNVTSILNQGSGIGLSITKEFVLLHGGDIAVESVPGKGTTFYLTLPIIKPNYTLVNETVDPPADDTVETAGEAAERVPRDGQQKTTVLLVEDNEEFRHYLKDSLQAWYHIIEAANGKDGWQKALATHPQLIVSDISMPVMNGIELSQKLKSDKRTTHIPIILLTAITGEQDQLKGLESGANDYLTKPFNFEILNAKIKNLLLYNHSLKNTYSKQIQVIGTEIEIESTDAKLLNTIVKYIDDKLNQPELSVEELSKFVGMSRGSLYRKLLEITGLTPIEYIRSVKLERAATFLEKSDYNVAQVAYMTGFGTPSYFSRLFKAKYGVLPSEYINLKRPDNHAARPERVSV